MWDNKFAYCLPLFAFDAKVFCLFVLSYAAKENYSSYISLVILPCLPSSSPSLQSWNYTCGLDIRSGLLRIILVPCFHASIPGMLTAYINILYHWRAFFTYYGHHLSYSHPQCVHYSNTTCTIRFQYDHYSSLILFSATL